MSSPGWLTVRRGEAPLVISLPHTGTTLPDEFAQRFVSPWLARLDTDWWVETLYDFAARLGATLVRTEISRSVIDVNRDPSGVSLYPGQATTELCPTTTFDGAALYRPGEAPDETEIARRRALYFDPYHAALSGEIARLRDRHPAVILYDCHSIRSVVPRLFDGVLPHLSIGTNDGRACAPALTSAIGEIAEASGFTHVVNGRFKGGFITRSHGRPEQGVHAVQMELAIRGYMDEPATPTPDNWPPPFHPDRARSLAAVLAAVLDACLRFARAPLSSSATPERTQ